MKSTHLVAAFAGLFLFASGLRADEKIVWSEDFESYEAGTSITNVANWVTTGPHAVALADGSKCLHFFADEGASLKGLTFNGLPDTTSYCTRYLFYFSCRMKVVKESQVYHGFVDSFLFDFINKNGNGYKVDCDRSYGSLLLTDGSFPTGQWADYGFVMELTPGQYKLLSMSVNGVTNDFNFATKTSGQGELGSAFKLAGWGSPEFYLDDFQVKAVLKEGMPELGVSSDGNLGLQDTQTTFKVMNLGGGSFEYAASVPAAYPFVTLENATGTCEALATVTFKVDRSMMGSQYYMVPVTVDAGETGSKTFNIGVASGLVMLENNFEHYEAGVKISEQDPLFQTAGPHYVMDDAGNQCLRFFVDEGSSLKNFTYKAVPATTNYCEDYNVKFSCRLKVMAESQVMHGIQEYFMFDAINKFGDGYRVDCDRSYGSLLLTSGSFPTGEWADYSFLMDITPNSYRLKSMTVNGVTDEFDVNVKKSGDGNVGSSIYFGGWGEPDIYMDDFRLELVEKEGDPLLDYSCQGIIGLEETNTTIKIFNRGGGTLNYKVSLGDDYYWCYLEGAEGQCKTTAEARLVLNREDMGDEYYRGTVTIDGGAAGKATFAIGAASGHVLYGNDFEFYNVGEPIVSQDGAWSGSEANLVTADDSACLRLSEYRLNMDTPSIKSYVNGNLVRFACRVKVANVGAQTVHGFENGFAFDALDKLEEGRQYVDLDRSNGGTMQLTSGSFEKNVWTDYGFVMDLRPGVVTLKSIWVGGVTNEFEQRMSDQDGGDLGRFILYGWGDPDVYLDDMEITLIERSSQPTPAIPSCIAASYMDKATGMVVNQGGGSCNASVKVLDYADVVSVTRPKDPLKAYENLTATITRGTMDDGFYRARYVYEYSATEGEASGSLTGLVSFGVGGWYYGADFQTPFFAEGPLGGQESWSASSESVCIEKVEGENCISFPAYGTAGLNACVPKQSAFTVKGKVLMEDLDGDDYIRIGTIDGYGYRPLYLVRDKAGKKACFCYADDEGEFVPVLEAGLGEWVDFSFTMDTDIYVASIEKMSFGDAVTNLTPGLIPLYPEYDDKEITSFSFTSYGEKGGLHLARTAICDSTLPEPALLGLALLLGMLAYRRRQGN